MSLDLFFTWWRYLWLSPSRILQNFHNLTLFLSPKWRNLWIVPPRLSEIMINRQKKLSRNVIEQWTLYDLNNRISIYSTNTRIRRRRLFIRKFEAIACRHFRYIDGRFEHLFGWRSSASIAATKRKRSWQWPNGERKSQLQWHRFE